jgi:hypothetical protein
MVTLYNKIFSDYQPCQLVKRRKKCFEDHLFPRPQGTDGCGEPVRVIYRLARCPSSTFTVGTLRTGTEMVLEMLVFSPFNQLTRLVAKEDFIMPGIISVI